MKTYFIDINGPMGNAFAIMGIVKKAMLQQNASEEAVEREMEDMKSGNYNHLLDVAEKWVIIEGR